MAKRGEDQDRRRVHEFGSRRITKGASNSNSSADAPVAINSVRVPLTSHHVPQI